MNAPSLQTNYFMKIFKLFPLLLLLLSVLFFACDDEDSEMPASTELQGTWIANGLDAEISSMTVSPNGTSSGGSSVSAVDQPFELTFDATTWTTTGGYDINLETATADGSGSAAARITTLVNENRTGTYSASTSVLTFENSFATLNINDMLLGGSGAAQVLNFSIDGDVLTITQDQEEVVIDGTTTTTISVTTTSEWIRQ